MSAKPAQNDDSSVAGINARIAEIRARMKGINNEVKQANVRAQSTHEMIDCLLTELGASISEIDRLEKQRKRLERQEIKKSTAVDARSKTKKTKSSTAGQ